MADQLITRFKNLIVPGLFPETGPSSIYAVFFRDGQEYDRRPLPDGTTVEEVSASEHRHVGYGSVPAPMLFKDNTFIRQGDTEELRPFPLEGYLFKVVGYEGVAWVYNHKET